MTNDEPVIDARGRARDVTRHEYETRTAERDALRDENRALRRELRALEWLVARGYAVGRSISGDRVRVRPLLPVDPTFFRTWAEAARSLGMEADDE